MKRCLDSSANSERWWEEVERSLSRTGLFYGPIRRAEMTDTPVQKNAFDGRPRHT